jgi:hypothetical protein
MSPETPIVEKKKRGGCCGGKKTTAEKVDNPVPIPKMEISPIVAQPEKGENNSCQCCTKGAESQPTDGNSGHPDHFLITALDDGRPQPIVTNFRCACGTFRGCCWGTCYPGCKCPGM